jgi:D-3-phosphoglycerate dehydrogenase
MRILFADALDPTTVSELTERGHECVVDPGIGSEDLPGRIPGFGALVVRSTRVTRETIEAADALELIVRAGAGTNTIDARAAADAGIYVTNVPGRNSVAVAELTMGLLLAIDRRIPDNVADLRAGRWNKRRYSQADGLLGKTMGIVGLGDIGLAVAERAAAFGLALLGLRKPGRPPALAARIASLGFGLVDTLEELVSSSDIVSIHVPANEQTAGLFDASMLALMRPGAILLNTSRGDVVDGAALLEALDSRGLRAGLDVYPDEPSPGTAEWSSKLAQHPNVVGTHHIGASTEQAQRAIAAGVVAIFDAFERGEIENCVNLEPGRLGTSTLHVRHLDRVGVLAAVFDVLRRRELNVEQMENRIFAGKNAAVATIDVVGDVTDDLLSTLASIPNVLHVSVVPATQREAR